MRDKSGKVGKYGFSFWLKMYATAVPDSQVASQEGM